MNKKDSIKLIRSALFVPGNRVDMIDKAFGFKSDVVIIDLEDSVPEDQKNETRNNLREKLSNYKDKKYIIRVNAINTKYFKNDIKKLFLDGLFAFMVPKVEKLDNIYQIYNAMEKVGERRSNISIVPLIESALGVQNVFEIVSNNSLKSRLLTVAFGAADYCLDMGINLTKNGAELYYPRSRIAIACRAAGIKPPIDTPYMLNLDNLDELEMDARRAKMLGFQGKLCIHPKQLETCNKIFFPTDAEIRFAEKAIKAYKQSTGKGIGAIKLDGKFLDIPIIQRCKDILEIVKDNKYWM